MKEINWSQFEAVDMRAGTIIEVNDFPKARNPAYQLLVDFGPLGIKKSSAQITQRYDKEDLIGQQVIAVINFPPKQIANFISECLVMGIYAENNEVVLMQPSSPVPNGSKVG